MSVTGPEGRYLLTYNACPNTNGRVDAEIRGVTMKWFVQVIDQGDEGVSLSGMTSGSQAIWHDQFWFELLPEATPPRIDYWGNQVLWRTDRSLDS